MAPDSTVDVRTVSNRIKQLNDIDKDVVRLLQSAGLAVKALTNATPTSDVESSGRSASREQQRDSFSAATSNYFALVSSLDVRLRRQIYALEEADILPAETFIKEIQTNLIGPLAASVTAGQSNGPSSRQKGSGKAVITGGGLGSLDVGWLNSRNDHVGKEMEAQLWDQAQRLVRNLEIGKLDKAPAAAIQGAEDDAVMQCPQTQHIGERSEGP